LSGAIFGGVFLALAFFAALNPLPLGGGTVTIWHWGGPIVPGVWVQVGPSRLVAWIFSGIIQKWLAGGGNVYQLQNAVREVVDTASLEWPFAGEFFKALFGQYIYKG